MSKAFTAPTELFIDLWCQKDEHCKAWRWSLYERGITVDRYGRQRSSRTGELING